MTESRNGSTVRVQYFSFQAAALIARRSIQRTALSGTKVEVSYGAVPEGAEIQASYRAQA